MIKHRKAIVASGFSLLALIVVGMICFFIAKKYASKPYGYNEKRVYVEAGLSKEQFKQLLVDEFGKEYGERVFTLYKRFDSDYSVPSGSYIIRPGEKAYSFARRLNMRRQDPIRFTFNNLRTLEDLASAADKTFEFSKESFLSAADSILSSQGVTAANYGAHFLPDTYEFYWTDSPQHVVEKITSNYNRFWNDERRAKASTIGLTPDQVSTLASIVESETNKSDERPKVARLYLNRLDRGMLLQADPTVIFALGDFSIRRVTNKHLAVQSPYNTYIHKGLPPGPIRLPEARTLDAVLNAPSHNYLYMCAKEDFSGYHNFAISYADHLANARRYQQKLDQLNR